MMEIVLRSIIIASSAFRVVRLSVCAMRSSLVGSWFESVYRKRDGLPVVLPPKPPLTCRRVGVKIPARD
jgi:hypothetical protein